MADDWMLAFAGPEGADAARFDRAAHLRGDDGWTASARITPVWRGKVLCRDAGGLAWLPPDHPALDGGVPAVFLGMLDGQPVGTRDISGWTPANLAETQLFIDPSEQRHPAIEGARFVDLRALMASFDAADGALAAISRAITGWHVSHRYCAACGHQSASAQSGWQRQCPACNAVHFPRTDPVVIMLVERDDYLLLGRSPGWPEGMYSCLAGFVEPGETVEAAVRREVFEETGVRVGPVRYVASQPWPFPASLMIGCAGVAETQAITLDKVELDDALWLPRAEVRQVMDGAHPTIRTPRRGPIAGWLIRGWLDGG